MSRWFMVLVLLCGPLTHTSAEQTSLETFPLSDVKLTAGPFLRAQRNDVEHVLSLDPDRLLAPYRREAGIASEVESYGTWEASGLDGHIGGHGAELYTVEYPIPPMIVDKSVGTLVIKFAAHKGSIAGGVYYVRLLREKVMSESTSEE